MKRLLVMLAVLSAAVYVGCKETEGDRCQVDDDCESGNCSTTEGTCVPSGTGNSTDDAEIVDAVPDVPDAS